MGWKVQNLPISFPTPVIFLPLGSPAHHSWTLGSWSLTSPLTDEAAEAWRGEPPYASSVVSARPHVLCCSDSVEIAAVATQSSVLAAFTLPALSLQPCRAGIFTPLMCALEETEMLSDLHKGTQLASGWPEFGLKVPPTSKPILFPLRCYRWAPPGSSEPDSQSDPLGHSTHPCSVPSPFPTSQALAWNLASVSRGEESHSVDPSFYSCVKTKVEIIWTTHQADPRPARDCPIRQCHQGYHIPYRGTRRHGGKMSIPFWHWTSRAERLSSHSYLPWRFSFISI